MRCIFCKCASQQSLSREHIIPQSLGNRKYVLRQGVVCDKCNNYFARKVEKPFMEIPAIAALRAFEGIETKKGKVPESIVLLNGHPVRMKKLLRGPHKAELAVPTELFQSLKENPDGTILLRTGSELIPHSQALSRFIAKVALEFLAFRLDEAGHDLQSVVDQSEMDDLRDHARKGAHAHWPVHQRRIYETHTKWKCNDQRGLQIVHESDFLFVNSHTVYFVLALFGMEYTINCMNPEIEQYLQWLGENGDVSPLHHGKNSIADDLPSRE